MATSSKIYKISDGMNSNSEWKCKSLWAVPRTGYFAVIYPVLHKNWIPKATPFLLFRLDAFVSNKTYPFNLWSHWTEYTDSESISVIYTKVTSCMESITQDSFINEWKQDHLANVDLNFDVGKWCRYWNTPNVFMAWEADIFTPYTKGCCLLP